MIAFTYARMMVIYGDSILDILGKFGCMYACLAT